MMKIIHNVRSADSPAHRQLRMRDDTLPVALAPWELAGSPPPRQKVLALGSAVWNSLLKPSIDLELDKIERSVVRTGPTRKLIDEGRVWAGGLTSQLRLAGQEPGPGDHVNASEVLDAAGDLLELLEEVAGGGASPVGESSAAIKITDGIRRIRRAAAKVNDTRTRIADANPLKRLTELSPQQRMSGPNSPENVAAREFWAKQGAPTVTRPIGDSIPTRVRDLVAQASRMPPSRERNELLAEAGRAQWSG